MTLEEKLEEALNEILVVMFKDILEIEAKSLITEEFKDISSNDMHIIEAIGVEEPKSMSAIAKLMSVTTGTLTKAMDALSEKGYVNRNRSKEDKRVVKICLTDKGRKAYYHHEQFHRQMINHIMSELTEEEMTVLIGAIVKMSDFFKKVYSGENEEGEFASWSDIPEK